MLPEDPRNNACTSVGTMMRWHVLAFAIVVVGCNNNTIQVTRNDEPWPFQETRAELRSASGPAQLAILLTDPGPPGVADGGSSYSLVVEFDRSVLAGDLPRMLRLNGVASFEYDAADPLYSRGPVTFEAGPSHDPLVSRAYVNQSCFCGGPEEDVPQEIVGALRLDEQAADGTLHGWIDVRADPIPPSFGDRVTIEGSFSALRID